MRKHPHEPSTPKPRGLRILAVLGGSLALALGGVLAVASSGNEVPVRRTVSLDPLHGAKAAFADRDFPRAESLTRDSLRSSPDSREAKVLLGRVLLERGRIAEARDLFTGLLKIQAEDVEALCGMGDTLRKSDQGDLAINFFQRAVKLRGNDPYLWKQLGMAQREKGDSMGALASLQRSLDLDSKQEDLTSLITELAAVRPEIPGAGSALKPPGADPRTPFAGPPRPRVPDPSDLLPKQSWRNR